MALQCQKHKLCQDCLQKNVSKYGVQAMYTCPAEECAEAAAPSPPIWIFVDNSNIWIGAKYLANKVKGFKSSKDHRVRISIGNLTDVVAKSRDVRQGILYGSEPPKIDSVWEKIRQHKCWEVKTKKRSYITHKEKEVDAQLLVDVTEVACITPPQKRSTIVLITGDADMCPAVEKIMKYEGWKVEIYMWEDSLSDRLKVLSKKNADVICEPLDDHMMDVVFTNNRFPDVEKIPYDCSAILTVEPDAFPKRVIDDKWWNTLESIAQWPVQYWWIIQDGNETNHLLLVFSHLGERKKYNVSSFVQIISDHMAKDLEEPLLPHVQRVETYVDYKRRMKKYESFMKYGKFRIGDVESESNFVLKTSAGSADEKVVKLPVFRRDVHVHVVDADPTKNPNASSANGTFKSVPPSQVGGQDKLCRFGKNCIRGHDCEFKHSDSDKIFFERNRGKGMPNRKTQMCKKYPSCHQSKDRCNFAHGDRDGWCLNCRQHGHFMKACPNPTQ